MRLIGGGGYAMLFGTQCFCLLMQGEPGFGMKGEKGDVGAPGLKVSDTDPLLSQ